MYRYEAGQAILVYPDPEKKGMIFPSLRLKLIQKGIDDFGYLAVFRSMAEEAARRRGSSNPSAEAQQRMRELASPLVKDLNVFDSSPELLEATRLLVAAEIEKLVTH